MRAPSLSFGLALAFGLLVVVSSARAIASEDGADLKARTHFAAGEYGKALDIYAQLYAETLHPTYLRNIARCHQNLGNADKAISSFREYLRKAKDLPPAGRAEIEGYIAEMEQLKRTQAAAAVATAPPPAGAEPSPALVGPPAVTAHAGSASDAGSDAEARPFYARAWFWGVVAGVAAAGVAVALLSADRSPVHGNVGVVDLRDNAP